MWSTALVTVVVLMARRDSGLQLTGIAAQMTRVVSVESPGRIQRVAVLSLIHI